MSSASSAPLAQPLDREVFSRRTLRPDICRECGGEFRPTRPDQQQVCLDCEPIAYDGDREVEA